MYGGDIKPDSVFRKILSIGYELETHGLVKLTRLSEESENGDPILLNTDTARYNVDLFNVHDIDPDNPHYESMMLRAEETFELTKPAKGVEFFITNDISSQSKIYKALKNICKPINNDIVDADQKNQLYSLQSIDQRNRYDINFSYADEVNQTSCSTFSGVEWISTFLNPKFRSNLILRTYVKTLEILLDHLDTLKLVDSVNLKLDEVVLHPDLLPERTTVTVGGNTELKLYQMPKSNLYYLSLLGGDKRFENIEVIPQMTFAAKAFDILSIIKQMNAYDYSNRSDKYRANIELYVQQIDNVERVTRLLLDRYNRLAPKHKITPEKNKNVYNKIFNYILLILYKLHVYYSVYIQIEVDAVAQVTNYFKNTLRFNCRHGNYVLYAELKKALIQMYDSSHKYKPKTKLKYRPKSKAQTRTNKRSKSALNAELKETERVDDYIINVIKRIIIQPDILIELLPNKIINIDDRGNRTIIKNSKISQKVFDLKYKLEPTDIRYGNPAYSLMSYFDFFKKPTPGTNRKSDVSEEGLNDNLYTDDTFIKSDWFEYARVDAYSSRMDLNNDIVLVELRGFKTIYADLVENILTAEEFADVDKIGSVNTMRTFVNRANERYTRDSITPESTRSLKSVQSYKTKKSQTSKKSNSRSRAEVVADFRAFARKVIVPRISNSNGSRKHKSV